MTILRKVEPFLEKITIVAALIASLALSVAYKEQVNSLRGALTVSCAERLQQHDAVHTAIGADVAYYKNQLGLLEQNYANQLKIIRSYPKASQAQAIRRVNSNRSALENVLAENQTAFVVGASFDCAH